MARKQLAHKSFQSYLPFYFHFSVNEGKDITFMYQLATFWRCLLSANSFLVFLHFDSP